MRTRQACWIVGPLAALAAVILVGSQAPQSRAQVVEHNPAQYERQQGLANRSDLGEKRCKASSLIGMNVRGLSGDDDIGAIRDLVIAQDGRIEYVAVSFGGILGMGDKMFAVPFEAIDFVKTDSDAYARIDVKEETLKQKQGFDQDTWPAEADHSFTSGKLRQQASASSISR